MALIASPSIAQYSDQGFALPWVDSKGVTHVGDVIPGCNYYQPGFNAPDGFYWGDDEFRLWMYLFIGQMFAVRFCRDAGVSLPAPVYGPDDGYMNLRGVAV